MLVPGFNDAHVHPVVPMTAYPHAVRVNDPRDFVPGPGPSTTQMLDLIAAAADASPEGTWIFGAAGTAILDDPSVDRTLLDARVIDHPVMLYGWSGHGMIFNSHALRVLGIHDDEPDPFGGFYERFPGIGIVNGIAQEYAAWKAYRCFFDRMTDAELADAYRSVAGAAAAVGYTSVQEIPIGMPYDRGRPRAESRRVAPSLAGRLLSVRRGREVPRASRRPARHDERHQADQRRYADRTAGGAP